MPHTNICTYTHMYKHTPLKCCHIVLKVYLRFMFCVFLKINLLFYVYEYFSCMYVPTACAFLVPTEIRRNH